ncbi:zinc finger CCCH domain-containing protein 1-like [Bidens hawaiensis]|uniref:zinc finger CCCH domain-containing protein 1-like n=1 Tax=Bidens hawaiensis TaxID=980011 RepID=UPI004049B698
MSENNPEQPPPPPQNTEQVCNFFRKPSKNKNIRKRAHDDDDEKAGEHDGPSVVIAKKKSIAPDNKLHFATASSKQTKQQPDADTKSSIFQFDSSKEIQVQNDSRATATLETETDFSQDARAIRERVLKQANEALKGKGSSGSGNNEKLYKGIHGYTDYKAGFRREQTVASEKAGGSHGPLRASAHIRVSARFDYQPDICKDYKETGYCGYGDSCKFMHDRGDYKSGWQMERDWDEAEKARKKKLALKGEDDQDEDDDDDEDDDEDGLPFACFICRQPFVDAVVTKCKHYFCEHCALKHHAKKKKCFVCNQPTLGIFNTAHEIRKRIAAEGK